MTHRSVWPLLCLICALTGCASDDPLFDPLTRCLPAGFEERVPTSLCREATTREMAAQSLPQTQAEPPSFVLVGGGGPAKDIPDWTRTVYTRTAVPGCLEESELRTLRRLMRNGQFYEARRTEGCTVLPDGLPATVLTTDGGIDVSFKVAISPEVGPPIILWASAYGFQN
jgi:hypothetical protein